MGETAGGRGRHTVRFFGFDIDLTLSFAHIVQIAGMLVFGLWIIFGYLTKIDVSQSTIAELSRQITQLQKSQNEQYTQISQKVEILADIKATVTQLNLRMDQTDNRMAAQSNRLDIVQTDGIQTKADLTALLRGLVGVPSKASSR